MQIVRTDRLCKEYKALSEQGQAQVEKAVRLFIADPSHPSLRTKRMAGFQGIWELRASDNYRITFEKLEHGVRLRRVGTHNVLRP